jgi:signal peptidase II
VSVVLMLWLRKIRTSEQLILAIGLSLVLGGALGNVIDRVWHSYVIDFIYFHWKDWYFPAFNVADSAISVGAGCLLIDAFLESGREKKAGGERRAADGGR